MTDFGTDTEKAGGTRFSEGKAPLVATPILGMFEVGRVSDHAARTKYALFDWWEGQSFSTLLNCAGRHLLRALVYGPMSRDKDSGCLHLGHAAWNILAALSFIEDGRAEELDDVTPWIGVTTAMKQEMEEAEAGNYVEPPADRVCSALHLYQCNYPECQCPRPTGGS